MSSPSMKPTRTLALYVIFGLLGASAYAFAQGPSADLPPGEVPPQEENPAPDQTPPPTPGWHRFSKTASNQPLNPPSAKFNADSSLPTVQAPDRDAPNDPPANRNNGLMPAQLTLKSGTYVRVRVDQYLSSDRNKAGDGFSATLEDPLVVDGVVVARRGQTIGGRVAEAEKAGRVKGVSRLSVRLTNLTLVDGQQLPIETQLNGLVGPTSKGRDAAAIATTTGVGATIGAAADWGVGAAIGAGAGALAGTVGVLLTRGHPSIIYPESVLTFRIASPVTISTERAPQAFRYVEDNDYDQRAEGPEPRQYAEAWGNYPCYPPPYYPYYSPYYPYYWGPSFSFFYGRRYYYGRPYFYGRGYYGRGYYGGRGRGYYGRGYYGGRGYGRGSYGRGFSGRAGGGHR